MASAQYSAICSLVVHLKIPMSTNIELQCTSCSQQTVCATKSVYNSSNWITYHCQFELLPVWIFCLYSQLSHHCLYHCQLHHNWRVYPVFWTNCAIGNKLISWMSQLMHTRIVIIEIFVTFLIKIQNIILLEQESVPNSKINIFDTLPMSPYSSDANLFSHKLCCNSLWSAYWLQFESPHVFNIHAITLPFQVTSLNLLSWWYSNWYYNNHNTMCMPMYIIPFISHVRSMLLWVYI